MPNTRVRWATPSVRMSSQVRPDFIAAVIGAHITNRFPGGGRIRVVGHVGGEVCALPRAGQVRHLFAHGHGTKQRRDPRVARLAGIRPGRAGGGEVVVARSRHAETDSRMALKVGLGRMAASTRAGSGQ